MALPGRRDRRASPAAHRAHTATAEPPQHHRAPPCSSEGARREGTPIDLPLLELVRLNLFSPVVLAFALGIAATLLRSDLRFPEALYTALSIYILLAIGLKGGAELAATPFSEFWRPAIASLVLGAGIPLLAYPVARRFGGLGVADAAALAAHYGSVSVVTFVVCLSLLDSVGIPYEGFMTAILALLELPSILVGLLIAQRRLAAHRRRELAANGGAGEDEGGAPWGETIRGILTGKGLFLLLGGLAMGMIAGPQGIEKVEPVFVDALDGVLVLFLLEMGMVTASRLGELRGSVLFLLLFGVLMPLVQGAFGILAGWASGLSVGGTTTLATLSASASYIVATVAVRLALPQANPSLYLTASLGITFPFNLVIGIPVYLTVSQWLLGG